MLKKIGYHRVSDNSITAFSVPSSGVPAVIGGLKQNWDVDQIWTRMPDGAVDFYFDKKFEGTDK